jgi:hypothetical protein
MFQYVCADIEEVYVLGHNNFLQKFFHVNAFSVVQELNTFYVYSCLFLHVVFLLERKSKIF